MREKVSVLITGIAVFFLLSDYTLKAKSEGFEFAVEKKDFIFNDFEHDYSVAGGWAGRDYIVTMKINSPDYKLNLKLVLKDNKASGNVNMKADKYEKPKHGKINNFGMCAANATRPLDNRTCKPHPPDHVTVVKKFLTELTRKDGFILMIGVFIGSVSILLIVRTVKGYRQRRQAWLEREAAEAAAAAAAAERKRKRASMINQKNRHKKNPEISTFLSCYCCQ